MQAATDGNRRLSLPFTDSLISYRGASATMFYEVVGWAGTVLVLLAYFLVSVGKVAAVSKSYQLMNLTGSVGLIVNTAVHHALPSVSLNVVWLLIALYGLLRMARVRATTQAI